MKDNYIRIGFTLDVGSRFKDFSKKRGMQYSQVLDLMMDYFEKNAIEPSDMDNEILSSRRFMSKRFNDVISIIKNIEKKTLLPTKAKMDVLFDEMSERLVEIEEEKEVLLEEKKSGDDVLYQERN